MKKGSIAAWRYLWKVRGWLPCSGKLKREIMARIKTVLNDYLNDHPDADFAELSHRFGTPKQVASSYVEDMDTEELLRNLRIRRRILGIVASTAFVVVALWVGTVTYVIIHNEKTAHGYIVVGPPQVIESVEYETEPKAETRPTLVKRQVP